MDNMDKTIKRFIEIKDEYEELKLYSGIFKEIKRIIN